jgi:hypothetical protein
MRASERASERAVSEGVRRSSSIGGWGGEADARGGGRGGDRQNIIASPFQLGHSLFLLHEVEQLHLRHSPLACILAWGET